jgi:hypothetical protein
LPWRWSNGRRFVADVEVLAAGAVESRRRCQQHRRGGSLLGRRLALGRGDQLAADVTLEVRQSDPRASAGRDRQRSYSRDSSALAGVDALLCFVQFSSERRSRKAPDAAASIKEQRS